MTPYKWVKDGVVLIGLLTLLFVGWWLYSTGYAKADAAWTVKYEKLQADYSRKRTEEVQRQLNANIEAKRREQSRIAALVEEKRQLEEDIEDLLHEAEIDPHADRVCLSDDSRLRINKVR